MTGRTGGDAELVARAQRGQSAAFAELVLRYQDAIYNSICHLVGDVHEAADLAQDVFLKAYRGIASFRGQAAFSTWLYRIMLNTVTSFRRRDALLPRHMASIESGRDADPPDGDRGGPVAPDADPTEAIMRQERVRLVRAAIGRLDEQGRQAIVLRDMEGCSYEQLAQILDVPIGTVKSRLHRARQALKELLAPVLRMDES